MALHLPSPPVSGFHAGPAFVHVYGLMYVIGITTPRYIPHHSYGLFAVWDGGLGIWGAVALAGSGPYQG